MNIIFRWPASPHLILLVKTKKKAEQQLYYAMKLQNELQQLDILIPGERWVRNNFQHSK